MLMTMIVWLLDQLFAPHTLTTKIFYAAGYMFLSVISVGFGFGFYWKVLESRGEASRSAESAVARCRIRCMPPRRGSSSCRRRSSAHPHLDREGRARTHKGKSCPNSKPGDGPRRKMREEDAPLLVRLRIRQGPRRRVKADMEALERRPRQDRLGRRVDRSMPRPAPATSSCARSAASSTSR